MGTSASLNWLYRFKWAYDFYHAQLINTENKLEKEEERKNTKNYDNNNGKQ